MNERIDECLINYLKKLKKKKQTDLNRCIKMIIKSLRENIIKF